ncbi:MAG: methylenetetrahydrofolate reductase [Endomicrobium sp.]|nr:methylenetetrahydrofolate reductase [Endomicrobium sp.]
MAIYVISKEQIVTALRTCRRIISKERAALKFKEKLKSNKFLMTAELFPPKGVDISSFLRRADCLLDVDAVNVTDNQRASMRAGSLVMSKILLEHRIEPILQIAARDKNRIALQSELLSANILDIENVLLLSGDHPNTGEYAGIKTVYDLDTMQLIKTARLLETGVDLAGKKLQGSPKFCIGAVANPSAQPNDLQALMFEKKVRAGAEFFQTQAIFDVCAYKDFFDKIKHLKVKVLPGIILIKSPKFMQFMQSLPGMNIPQKIQDRINSASDSLAEGIKICSEIVKELRSFADGVHIMAIGIEEYIPEIIKMSL